MLAKKCCWFYGQQKSGAFEAFFVLWGEIRGGIKMRINRCLAGLLLIFITIFSIIIGGVARADSDPNTTAQLLAIVER